MKTKTLFLAVAVVALANHVLGQGQVILANNSSSLVRIGDPITGPAVPVGTMSFQLYFGLPGTYPLIPVGPIVPTSSVAAGRIQNTVINIPMNTIPAGSAATFQIRAWSSSFPSYAAAQSGGGLTGKSAVFSANTSQNGAPPPQPTSLAGLYPGFAFCLANPPYIVGQPESQSVYVGSTVTFDVTTGFSTTPYYVWRKNGSAIDGGRVQSPYTITGATTNDAGNYDVVVMNCAGEAYSAIAILEVLPLPPIQVTPASQTAELGTTATFRASLPGAGSEICQWFFNRTNRISDATNSVLLLEGVQFNQAGEYSVVFTGAHGAVTSAPAMLNVIAPVGRRWMPGLTLKGQPGSALNLDAADTLVPVPNWAGFDSVLLTNSSQWYFDLTASLPPQRFYRAWQSGVPAVPVLNAYMVPALTLTGSVGSSVRVDGINRIGPTDAWFALATVALTNTSQLYTDVSVIGQPTRLYRIVPVP